MNNGTSVVSLPPSLGLQGVRGGDLPAHRGDCLPEVREGEEGRLRGQRGGGVRGGASQGGQSVSHATLHGHFWTRVARWQNLIPSFPWILPGWRVWGVGGNPRNFAA